MAIEDTSLYQTLVGRLQGAKKFFIADGGKLEGASGGIMELEAGFQFYLEDSSGAVTATQMKNALHARLQQTIIGQGATSTAFSVEEYVPGTRMIVFSMTSTCIAGSFNFSTVVQGEEVIVKVHQGSTISGEVELLFSGCSYVGLVGTDLDSVMIHNSDGSTGWIRMQCFTDDEWTVVGYHEILCEE